MATRAVTVTAARIRAAAGRDLCAVTRREGAVRLISQRVAVTVAALRPPHAARECHTIDTCYRIRD